MKLLRIQSLFWLATLVAYGSAITLIEVLSSYPQLSSLYSYINSSSTVTSLLANSNDFTFLAPSNDAIASFNSQNPDVLSRTWLANVQYGLLQGGFPTLSFSDTPQFVASNLVNGSYANVTSGQAVELVLGSDGTPEVVTGNKSISTSTAADIVCVGGIVHIIDSLLSIPLSAVLEITAAQLEYFVSFLNVGGYLNSNALYVNEVLEISNVTFFIPNSAAALAEATQLAQNSTAADLQALFQYHIVPDFVGYSTLLKTGMSLQTMQGTNLTITLEDGEIFVNSAKVIESDFIVANGVMHVIDNLLNRFDTSPPPSPGSAPTTTITNSTALPTSTVSPTNTTSTLPSTSHSTSSKVTLILSLGLTLGLVFFLAAIAFFINRRRRKRASYHSPDMSGTPVFPSSAPKFNVQRGQVQRQENLGLGLGSSDRRSTGMLSNGVQSNGMQSNGMQSTGMQSPGMQSTRVQSPVIMQNMDAMDDGASPISPVVSPISRSPSQSANWALREGMDGY